MMGQAAERQPTDPAWGDPTTVTAVSELAALVRQLRRREARRREGSVLTYRELAAKTGWSRTVIGGYLAGTTLPPTDRFDVLIQLLGATPVEQRTLATARDRVDESRHPVTARPVPDRTAGAVVPRQLPTAVRAFAGRRAELDRLAALADEAAGAVVILAVDGTAGIGKTALVISAGHHIADRFPDGQLYANLRGFDQDGSAVEPGEVIRRFLDALAVSPDRIPADVSAQAALYRSLLASRRMLVVLDNAADAAQVRPLLPGTPGCLVLVTSRNRLTGLVAAEGAEMLTLELLGAADARDLLAGRLGAKRVAGEPAAVQEIINRCAGLPLTLSILSARAAEVPRFPLATLAEELRAANGGLDAFDGGEPTTDVRSLLSWSTRRLSAEAARMLRLLALHRGADIGVAAAASLAGRSAPRVRHALAELCRANLLHEHIPGRYALHDLIRAYAAELLQSQETGSDRQAAVHRLLDHYLHTAYAAALVLDPHRAPICPDAARSGVVPEQPADYPTALRWYTAEQSAVLAALDLAAGTGFRAHTWQLAWTMATFLDRQGRWADLAATHRAALQAARQLADRPAQARAHSTLGRACAMLGQHGDARRHLDQAGQLYVALGEHAGSCCVQSDLAWLLGRQGSYRGAMQYAEEAMAVYRATGHRTGQARALSAIGLYQSRLGTYAQALASCRLALHLQKENGDRRGEAATWNSTGAVHHHAGQYAAAAAAYSQAAVLFGDLGDGYYQATALRRLGRSRQASGDLAAAWTARQAALAVLDRLQHPEAADLRAELACGTPARHSETPVGRPRIPVRP